MAGTLLILLQRSRRLRPDKGTQSHDPDGFRDLGADSANEDGEKEMDWGLFTRWLLSVDVKERKSQMTLKFQAWGTEWVVSP